LQKVQEKPEKELGSQLSEKQDTYLGSEDRNPTVNDLTLRSLLPSGGENQIVCSAGEVTVLSNMPGMDELRTALLEWRELDNVIIQFGSKPLSGQDVFQVTEYLSFEHNSALEELISYGVEPEIAFNLLFQIGLEVESAQPIENLSKLQSWRLKILCGLKSDSRVNHIDFFGFRLPEQCLEVVCEEIRQGAQKEGKIVIVTGLDNVPKCLRNASNVRIQGSGKAGELLLGSRENFLKKKADLPEQKINVAPAKVSQKTQLKMEAIPNLNFSSSSKREDSTIQVVKRRSSSRNLTKVRGVRSLTSQLRSRIRALFSKR